MTHNDKPELVGRRIVAVKRMPPDPSSGRTAVMALVLDDGTWLWPSVDDEGELPPSIVASDSRGADWALETDYREEDP